MAPDGTPPNRLFGDREAYRDDRSGNYSGIFAPYSKDPETILELLAPERYPLPGETNGVANSYISGMAALQQVFSPAGVGKFVRPRENTWIRHELAVIGAGLDFNTKRYEFDQIVAHFAQIPAAFDPEHRKFDQYSDLRMNLAVLRNFLLNHFFPDGDVDNDLRDQNAAHALNQVAMHVGKMLHRGKQWTPTLGPSVTPSRANIKGDGAAEIYEKLRRGETLRKVALPVMGPVNLLRNRSNMLWRLPPLEETPFDPRNLNAPLDTVSSDSDVSTNGGGRPDAQSAMPDKERWDVISHSFEDLGGALAGATVPLATVDELSQPVKDRAIALAREILDKLKLKFAETPVEALLDRVDTSEVYRLLRETQRLSDLFYAQAGRAALTHPNLFYDPEMQLAFDALGKLSCQAKLQALKYAEESGSSDNALQIARDIEAMPASWRMTGQLTVGQLLGSIQLGFEKILLHLQEQNHATSESYQKSLYPQDYSQSASLSAAPMQGLAQTSMSSTMSARPRASISPLQQQMQQVMAANQMANLSADRRASSLESGGIHSSATTPSVAAISAATPPARSRRPSGASRRSGSAVHQAAQRSAMLPVAPPAPTAASTPFGDLLNSKDLASMRSSVDQSLATGPVIGPKRARERVQELANRQEQTIAGAASPDSSLHRPGNTR